MVGDKTIGNAIQKAYEGAKAKGTSPRDSTSKVTSAKDVKTPPGRKNK